LDTRLEALRAWVREVLKVNECDLRPASSEASARCYYRIGARGTAYIVMDAPPQAGDCRLR